MFCSCIIILLCLYSQKSPESLYIVKHSGTYVLWKSWRFYWAVWIRVVFDRCNCDTFCTFFSVSKVWICCIVVNRETGADDPGHQRSEMPLQTSRLVHSVMSGWGGWVHSSDTSAGCLKLSMSRWYKAPHHCLKSLCHVLCLSASFCIFHGTCTRQRKMHAWYAINS